MLRDLQAFDYRVSEFIEKLDRSVVERLNQLSHSAREAIGDENWSKARQIIDQMTSTYYRALYQQPEFILGMFAELAVERFAALDKNLHDSIVVHGVACAEAGNIDGVRSAAQEILRNQMPNQVGAKRMAVLAGLVA